MADEQPDPFQQTPGQRSRTWMLIIGLVALVAGGIYAWNGYRDAMASQVVFDAFPSGLHADFTQMWVGIVVAGVGAVLSFTAWIIAASRR